MRNQKLVTSWLAILGSGMDESLAVKNVGSTSTMGYQVWASSVYVSNIECYSTCMQDTYIHQ